MGLKSGLLLDLTSFAKKYKLKFQSCSWKKRGQSVAEVFGEADPEIEKGVLRPRKNSLQGQGKSHAHSWDSHRK